MGGGGRRGRRSAHEAAFCCEDNRLDNPLSSKDCITTKDIILYRKHRIKLERLHPRRAKVWLKKIACDDDCYSSINNAQKIVKGSRPLPTRAGQ